MGTAVSDYIDIRNDSQGSLSISTTAAQSGAIANSGVYDVWSDVDCFVKVASVADDVTPTTGYKLFAGNSVPIRIDANQKLGGVTASGSGTLAWHRVAT